MDIEFTVIHCADCGMPFAITQDRKSRLRECHNTFYCPAGHPQSFTGKTEAEKLREKVEEQERSLKYFRDLEAERAAESKKKLEAHMKKQRAAHKKAKAKKTNV